MTEAPDREPIAGRYRLRELVGTGGMGAVWRASDELLGREVALKQVRLADQQVADIALARERIMREARIAAALHHPHIVSIFDVVLDDGEPWLVLEFLPSRSLGSVLAERRTLPPLEVAAIGADVAAALAAAHAKGIVHRDVKPDNVLLSRPSAAGPVVKLTDFGISHAATSPVLTATHVLTGTPAYFAPETARGEGGDARSDVYALGATLYAAVEGHPPFGWGEANVLTLLARIGRGGAPPPRRAGPLTEVLLALIADDPAARPTAAHAHHMLQWLAQSLDPASVPTRFDASAPSAPLSHPAPLDRPRRPGRVVAAGVAVLTAIVLAAAVVTQFVIGTSPDDPAGSAQPTPLPTGTPTNGELAMGDPQTADPCSLLDTTALSRYGPAVVDPDSTRFDGCRAIIRRPDQSEVGVYAYLNNELEAVPGTDGTPGKIGPLTVIRYPLDEDSCDRLVMLPDRTGVTLRASVYAPAPATTEVCEIAETATSAAVDALTQRGIGRKAPVDTPNTLARVNACGLLQQADLAVIPGLAAGSPQFGGWGCSWSTNIDPATTVEIAFVRGFPLTDADGEPADFAGRPGRIRSTPGSCSIHFVQREYVGGGAHRVELVWVSVTGAGSDEELRRYATTIAASAANRLPPSS